MAAQILDGKALAAATRARLKHEVEALVQRGVRPGLSVVIAGEDPASRVYVRNKTLAAEQLDLNSKMYNNVIKDFTVVWRVIKPQGQP